METLIRSDLVRQLDSMLETSTYRDMAINGLQVASPGEQQVKKIAFAVDAGLSVVEKAVNAGAEMLVVHHGIFWGDLKPIIGTYAEKISLLLSNNCALYASHLPLDGHQELGNGSQLLDFMGAISKSPFCYYKERPIGSRGEMSTSFEFDFFKEKARQIPGYRSHTALPFGSKKIRTVAAVTGSGTFAIEEAKQAGIDLLVSGEPKQEAYHMAKEAGMNVLFVGHYASETFGVLALKQFAEEEWGVETLFIDEPTGI